MNLLEIKNLRVRFRRFMPVKGVSLAIKSGELVALVGASGSGKSTVAMSILRLQEEACLSGEILFGRQDLLTMDEADLIQVRGHKIAMIFQEPMSSLNPLHTAGAQIAEALKIHKKEATKQRVYELLSQVELTDVKRIYRSYPHELSGGQRQRVMIAMALAGGPDLLIADEPTTALDVSVQAQILTLLKHLQQKLNLAILFITHDLDIVRRIADRVYVMKAGRIISTKTPPEKHEKIRSFCPCSQAPVLTVRHLYVRYHRFEAVKDVSFELCPGQTIGIVGESGSGKSSLGQGITRLIAATGQVLVRGEDFFSLSGRSLRQARGHVQMVLQDPASSLNPRMMIADIVGEGLKVQGEKNVMPRVIRALQAVGLDPYIKNRYPHELSGGQRTRVALARALILNPAVLVLDEVTSSLDIRLQRQLIALLSDLQKRYDLAYVFISHDMKVIRALADFVLVMKEGQVVEQGLMTEVFKTPQHPYTASLMRASFAD